MQLEDFDYELPPELIAQAPAPERTASRLLHLNGETGRCADRQFRDLPGELAAGDVVVFNDTRVIKARLAGRKRSGGRIEALIERIIGIDEAWAQLRASHAPHEGSELILADAIDVRVMERRGDLFRLRFPPGSNVFELLERYGSVPLPPYITHAAAAEDEERYQTVYAREPGAVAAPTAGLHFDAPLMDAIRARGAQIAYVTLHVGAGTFQPVRVSDLSQHRMHSEWYDVPEATVAAIDRARAQGRRVMAVGTTTLRALETAGRGTLEAGCGETRLFIVPGYRFSVVDRLVTNFHLPQSTLLMLVSAFAGLDPVLRAYRHAVEARYRFFSYGDAMLIERAPGAGPAAVETAQ